MKTIVFKISPDGKTTEGLYDDFLTRGVVSPSEVRRISEVEFDPSLGGWATTLILPTGRMTLLEVKTRRKDALQYEIETINQMRKEGKL